VVFVSFPFSEKHKCMRFLALSYILVSARNGSVYAGIPYCNLFWFLNIIPVLINNTTSIYHYFTIFLTVYPCTGTSKLPFRALVLVISYLADFSLLTFVLSLELSQEPG
jgi:hypothetical protein